MSRRKNATLAVEDIVRVVVESGYMVTALQLDVGLVAGSYAGLDQPHRGGVSDMIINRPIDQQRLVDAIEIAAHVCPQKVAEYNARSGNRS